MEQDDMMKRIDQRISKRSKDGRIACRIAREIAEELEVSYRTVGDRCKATDTKIVACQLGCF